MSDEMQQDTAAASQASQSGDAQIADDAAQSVSTDANDASASAQTSTQSEDRSWQSRYDRLQQEVGNDLRGYVKQFGGGQNVVGFLKQLESLVGNPTLGPIVKGYLQTGQVDLPKGKPTNEWDEPVQEPEWKAPMNSVLQELQTVRQELSQYKTRQGMAAITEHTKKFKADYPMSGPESALFDEYMDSQWSTIAANPNGASLLGSMDYRTFKTLGLPGIEEFRSQIEARKIAKQRSQVSQKATDAPATASGKEKPPNGSVPQSHQQLLESVRQAYARAASE